MRRFQLIEVLDQSWCPATLRDTLTEYLQFTISVNNPYQTIVPTLSEALSVTRTRFVVDMCAGAGGPWLELRPALEQQLNRPLMLVLTDRFPHTSTTRDDTIATVAADARALPFGASVFRTVFAGFHHFAPQDASLLLEDAVAQRHGIGIFEVTQRSIVAMLLMVLSAVALLFTAPFIRPWRWSRLFWTYVVPLAPLIVFFDGVVSCMRTYTPDEMHDLIQGLDTQGYVWQIDELPISGTPLKLTYTIGYPQPTP